MQSVLHLPYNHGILIHYFSNMRCDNVCVRALSCLFSVGINSGYCLYTKHASIPISDSSLRNFTPITAVDPWPLCVNRKPVLRKPTYHQLGACPLVGGGSAGERLFRWGTLMTSWHGNAFCVVGICEENHPSAVDSPHKWTSNGELWYFFLLWTNSNRSCWWFQTPWPSSP